MTPALRRTALAALLGAGVVGVATWVVFFSPVLGVREVRVTGNVGVPAERVRQAVGVRLGTPLATVNLTEVQRRVSAVREVESVRVERGWPGTLRVTVVERTPVAVVPVDGGSALVDRFGVVLRRMTVAPPRLPVLQVQRLAADDPATRSALAVLEALPEKVRERVQEVRAPSARSITLRLIDGRTVLWGDARDAAAKGRLLGSALNSPGSFYDVSSTRVVTIR